jgi:hypothetical protein
MIYLQYLGWHSRNSFGFGFCLYGCRRDIDRQAKRFTANTHLRTAGCANALRGDIDPRAFATRVL